MPPSALAERTLEAPVAPTPVYAWALLAFLTLLNVVNFVDRELINGLQVHLKSDLGLSNHQVMLLSGYAFTTLYCLFGIFLGSIADRWSRTRLIAAGLAVWSAATAASGLATSFWDLGAARILVGMGEATLTPAAVAMLGDVFRTQRRSLATGIYYLGIPLGAGMSYIVSGTLAPTFSEVFREQGWFTGHDAGWRGCFLLLGSVGLALVAVLWFFVSDPPRGGMDPGRAARPSSRLSSPRRFLLVEIVQTLVRSPALALTMLGASLLNIGVGASWLNISWLTSERGLSRQDAGVFLGTMFLIGGSTGNLLGGWLGDRFHRITPSGRLIALIVVQLAIIPFSIAFRFMSPDVWWLFAASCAVSGILVTFMYGPVLATVQELAPVRQRATMVAVLLIGQNMIGASLGAVLAAELVGRLGSYTWGIFWIGMVSLSAIPVFALAAWRYQTDLERGRGNDE